MKKIARTILALSIVVGPSFVTAMVPPDDDRPMSPRVVKEQERKSAYYGGPGLARRLQQIKREKEIGRFDRAIVGTRCDRALVR